MEHDVSARAAQSAVRRRPHQHHPRPRGELQVSRIAFGTWELGGDRGTTDEKAAVAAIGHAVDRGINFFDTAQGYGFGASEHLLAQALQGRPRDQVVIATKGGHRPDPGRRVQRDASPQWVRQGIDESLQALDTDYIDLYQIHWPDPKTPFEAAGALADLMAAGKVRHVGVSNFDAEQMEEFSRTLPVETLPRSCPTRGRTTSGSWSTGPSPTASLAGP